MSLLFCTLDFLCPLLFYLLGRSIGKGKRKTVLISESVFVFLLALLFAPITYRYFSLLVQGILCAGLLFVQFFFVWLNLFLAEKENRAG